MAPCSPSLTVFRGGKIIQHQDRINGSDPSAVGSDPNAVGWDPLVGSAQQRSDPSDAASDPSQSQPTLFVVGCDGCASGSLAALLELQPGAAMGVPLEARDGMPPEEWWMGENPAYFSQVGVDAG